MKIQFIFHSSYLIETERCYLLFDYYQGELPELDTLKPLYVLASHNHYDHFSPVVFQLIRKYPATVYVLSDDISVQQCEEAVRELGIAPPKIRWIHPGIEYTFPECRVEAFGSTDHGVSFLVEADGMRLFHAGDLNDWCWTNVPKSQSQAMQQDYLAELAKLSAALEGATLDAAFIPVDPVLGDGQFQGPREFLESISVRHTFPMHMWERYSVGEKFLAGYPKYRSVFQPIRKTGERFLLERDGELMPQSEEA